MCSLSFVVFIPFPSTKNKDFHKRNGSSSFGNRKILQVCLRRKLIKEDTRSHHVRTNIDKGPKVVHRTFDNDWTAKGREFLLIISEKGRRRNSFVFHPKDS